MLRPQIIQLLQNAPILRPRSSRLPKIPKQLRYLPSFFLDQNGDPLFSDLDDEIYLSPEYQWGECGEILRELGVQDIRFVEILSRIQSDLATDSSRMRTETDDDWHTRVAKLLIRLFDRGDRFVAALVKRLKLIPLENGEWVSISTGYIYYPENNGVPVPKDLDLLLVSPDALKNSSRRTLFSWLGVKDCNPETVISKILGKYNIPHAVNLESSVAHVRYLFWNLPAGTVTLDQRIYIFDQDQHPVYRKFVTYGINLTVDDLYFETEEEYDTKQLCKKVVSADGRNVLAPGHPVHFIHSSYLDAVSPEVCRDDRSWESWLELVAGIRRYPSLTKTPISVELSGIFVYIINHRPEKLVGTLKTHWDSYVTHMQQSTVDALACAHVPCEHSQDMPLRSTYLPKQNLKEKCQDLGVSQIFPFLQLSSDLGEGSHGDLDFLTRFEVGAEEDLQFYLTIIKLMVRGNQEICSGEIQRHLFKVYQAIENHCKTADNEIVR